MREWRDRERNWSFWEMLANPSTQKGWFINKDQTKRRAQPDLTLYRLICTSVRSDNSLECLSLLGALVLHANLLYEEFPSATFFFCKRTIPKLLNSTNKQKTKNLLRISELIQNSLTFIEIELCLPECIKVCTTCAQFKNKTNYLAIWIIK